ncbi:cfem domain-containing protein [Colletotrichum incanum]|uniref:Cfem domain-containing protein n=1 Tax=Colletotrichum incanum TaxID=1573173 RepID=A0A167BG72_COLIC|nr:cfem domain-containing protein [Colletotrichum incanum]OHW93137.1 CFEM domain-containing protein [Colletotrichum incanum]
MIELVAKRAVQARWANVEDLPSSPLQKVIMAILFVFTLTAFLTWALRMYSKITSKQIGLDDWFMTGATFFSIALLGPTYMFFKYYYAGFPTSSLPEAWDPSPMLFWNWIMQVLYNPILALVKSSVLVFLLRLGGHKPGVRYAIYALNAINLATMVAIFLVVLFQTIPINAFWDSTIPKQREIDGPLFYIVSAIITIVTDFFVLAIPFWIFLGLKMRMAAKIGLIVVFLAGGVSIIVAILRVHELRKKFYNLDPGYDARNGIGDTYSAIEVNLSIIAACIPALRPLFRKWMPGMFSNKSSAGNAGYNSSQYAPYGVGTGNGTGASRLNRNTAGNGFPLKDMRNTHTEIRGHSPDGSEEEIMTFNGIIRTTNVQVTYNDPNSFMTDKESGTENVDAEKPVRRNSKFGLGSNV